MKASRLRKGHILLHEGHAFRITAIRKRGLRRTVTAFGFYVPSGAPGTYVLNPQHEVETR
ncbi:hypothetical protein Q7689_00130 [Nocardiopsis tropica]|uniref:hypothetical protein n=1 Tax=Nocardiopsis tropica TaxID=109330 RepID=UPI002E83CF87|nr:hypothetical protein [Nocardiopsis tropica]